MEQEALPLKQVERTKKTTSSLGISVKGVGDIWVKLARCCMPVPGDNIIGFITAIRRVRASCGLPEHAGLAEASAGTCG